MKITNELLICFIHKNSSKYIRFCIFLSKTIFMLLYLANGDQLLSLNLILSPLSIITGNKLSMEHSSNIYINYSRTTFALFMLYWLNFEPIQSNDL